MTKREDVTKEALADPAFWATFARTWRGGGGHDFFEGLTEKDVNAFYESFLTKRIDAGTRPFLRVHLDKDRYVEVEYTEDFEERYWIGTDRPKRRVLLAYYSGHDSLPAFRFEELEWIVDRLPEAGRVLGLLLAKACFFPSDSVRVQQLLWRVVELIPGLREDRAQELVAEFLEDQVRESVWIEDSVRGWVSGGGGRDPESPLSVLKAEDLRFISEFFR